MTLEEMNQYRADAHAALKVALYAHRLTDLERDYLAEILMECRGESNITTDPEKAQGELHTILDFLECSSRIAPRERQRILEYAGDKREA